MTEKIKIEREEEKQYLLHKSELKLFSAPLFRAKNNLKVIKQFERVKQPIG